MEVILKFIVDASSTQLYMLGWRNSPANFVEEVGLIHESTYNMAWTHSLLLQAFSYKEMGFILL